MTTEPQTRCFWAGESDLMIAYHDHEWGVPTYDDRELFERLILEASRQDFSWRTILHKREKFPRRLRHFDAEKMAAYDEAKVRCFLARCGYCPQPAQGLWRNAKCPGVSAAGGKNRQL